MRVMSYDQPPQNFISLSYIQNYHFLLCDVWHDPVFVATLLRNQVFNDLNPLIWPINHSILEVTV